MTGGSRVTFATGMATVQAAEKVIDQLKRRAAMIWDVSPEAVDWKDGCAVPAGANAGSFRPAAPGRHCDQGRARRRPDQRRACCAELPQLFAMMVFGWRAACCGCCRGRPWAPSRICGRPIGLEVRQGAQL